jgi:sugar phosphate isomerase/epimerase
MHGLTDGAPARRAPIERVGGSKLKLSLNAYSFSGELSARLQDAAKGMSLFDLLAFCAQHDFDALDPTGYFFPGYPQPPSDEYLNGFKRRAFELGLDISGSGVRNNFASPDSRSRAADVRHVQEWIECAARMGAPVLRVFAGPQPQGHTWDEVAEWMASDLRECAEYGKRYGVIVGLQNHGDMLRSAADVLRMIDLVDSDWFGAIVDTGFLLTADPYDDMARLAPYAVNWQIKETLHGKDSGEKIDLPRAVRAIRQAGYRGYLPIETLPVTGETYDARRQAAQLGRALRLAIRQTESEP